VALASIVKVKRATAMKPKWIIEKELFRGDDPDAMAAIVRSKGMECVRVQYVPMSDSFEVSDASGHRKLYSSNMPYLDGECVVVIGSLNLCRALCSPRRWTPTAWFNLENLRCSSYYANWKDLLLQTEYQFCRWGDLRAEKDSFYERLGADGCIFIKPDENLKMFSGSVVPIEKFDHWAEMNKDCYEIPDDAQIVVARPLRIGGEWRFVICRGEVIAGSMYKENGRPSSQPGFTAEAREVAEKIAKHSWQPDSVYVADVCSCGDGHFLLECGPFNGAGLYKCDLEPIVEKISVQAILEWTCEQVKKSGIESRSLMEELDMFPDEGKEEACRTSSAT
jgi:hypothetical protein